jgi:signal transduction histidine kinase
MAVDQPAKTTTTALPTTGRTHAGSRRRFWRPMVLLFGLAISTTVAGIVHGMLADERRAQDEATRESLSAGLQSHIDRKLGFVRFLRGLYVSSDFVSADEFKRFAEIDPAVQAGEWWFAVAWVPRSVSTPSGNAVPPAYVEPPRAAPAGNDAGATDPSDIAAMRRAAALREMTVSEPRAIADHAGMQVKAFMPVFKDGAASGELQGFLIASIATDGFFDDFLHDAFTDTGISLRIYDGSSLVFSRGPEEASRSATDLLVGNQQWRLEIGRNPQALAASLWLPGLVFVIGMALSGLLYLHQLRTDTEYERISEQVGLATAELAGANARLADRSAALQQVADDLRRTSQEAQLANSAKTVFLANMSHELRTPLNAIIGFAGLIGHRALGEQPAARYAEYARDIEHSGRYLLSIIEDLLDMSRIELGQVRLVEEPVEVEDLAKDVVRFVSHRAHERGITIDVGGVQPMPRINADARSLRQALINLLVNAIKFSPPGGSVAVCAAPDSGGGIAIWVQDSGPGIKAEEKSSAFEPFWQGDAYRRKARDGVGLGLAITKRLIEAHGGTVELISGDGMTGTRAMIRLPASRVLRGRPQLAVIGGGGTAA